MPRFCDRMYTLSLSLSFSTNLFVFNLFTLTPCWLRGGGSGMDNEVYITLALIPRANENPTCQTVPVVT